MKQDKQKNGINGGKLAAPNLKIWKRSVYGKLLTRRMCHPEGKSQEIDDHYQARTVAKGFSQIPGKDFQENFAPVINDASFHLILVL
jgi:hypothetical protein